METFRFQIAESDLALLEQAWKRSTDRTPQEMAHRFVMHGVRRTMAAPTPEDEAAFDAAMDQARKRSEKSRPREGG